VGSAAVVIQAPPPCGEARYVVRYDVAPRRDQPWTLTFTQPDDRCADRVEILVGSTATSNVPSAAPEFVTPSSAVASSRVWTHQPSRLVVGQRYGSWSFTEPFQFVMPADGPTSVFTWLAPGHLHFSHPYWAGDVFDDWELPTDRCHPAAGSIPDIPSTPQAFEAWLRSNGRAIDRSAGIAVDGRTARRYDTSELASAVPTDCPGGAPGERDWNTVDFLSRWYLIPTGDDTILFNVYGDTDTEYQAADALVRSMTFDQP
jgi:hypothetical protein